MKYVYWAIIAGLCYGLIRIDSCSAPAKTVVDTAYVVHRDTAREHVPVPFKVEGEKIYVPGKGKIVYRDRPAHVDTAKILADFYGKVFYNDTARVKWGTVFIRDTVSQNRIVGRSVLTDFHIPTITTTITKTEAARRMLFVGVDIGYGVGVSAAYKTKTDHLLSAGYMLTQHGGILDLSYKWKISIH